MKRGSIRDAFFLYKKLRRHDPDLPFLPRFAARAGITQIIFFIVYIEEFSIFKIFCSCFVLTYPLPPAGNASLTSIHSFLVRAKDNPAQEAPTADKEGANPPRLSFSWASPSDKTSSSIELPYRIIPAKAEERGEEKTKSSKDQDDNNNIRSADDASKYQITRIIPAADHPRRPTLPAPPPRLTRGARLCYAGFMGKAGKANRIFRFADLSGTAP